MALPSRADIAQFFHTPWRFFDLTGSRRPPSPCQPAPHFRLPSAAFFSDAKLLLIALHGNTPRDIS